MISNARILVAYSLFFVANLITILYNCISCMNQSVIFEITCAEFTLFASPPAFYYNLLAVNLCYALHLYHFLIKETGWYFIFLIRVPVISRFLSRITIYVLSL